MKFNSNSQSGQSLIETIVAVFILVTALVAGLGLALYAVANSTNAKNQLVASNFARQGIEAIRMMRDTNWLVAEDDPLVDDLTSCTFPNPAPNDVRPCYPETFGANGSTSSRQYNLSGDVIVQFDGNVSLEPTILYSNFLCQQTDGSFRHTFRIAGPNCPIPVRYARSVTITTGNTSPPFTPDTANPTAASGHSPEKIVTSTVVWQGRKCTPFPTDFWEALIFNPATFNTPCKLTITEHLTNWKDYR
jgi:type II secretory pathway pseudopilin PulG